MDRRKCDSVVSARVELSEHFKMIFLFHRKMYIHRKNVFIVKYLYLL